jgi:glucokinase
MYLGVDVGGSKVLAAVLDDNGVIVEHTKFGTPGDYHDFLQKLAETVAAFTTKDFQAAGIGIPATSFDRASGQALTFGNLPWRNVAVQADIERLFHCPVVVENDAKLGALSEAMLLKDTFKKVLYIALGTGIGIGLVDNGRIDTSIGDAGGRLMLVEHQGKHVPWEELASGKAILKRYGKPAHDIEDPSTWKTIARHMATGFVELIALTEPEVIVIGGSIGVYFDRFGEFLEQELKRYETPLLKAPALRGAARSEEAVVYGCYDLAKETYGKHG